MSAALNIRKTIVLLASVGLGFISVYSNAQISDYSQRFGLSLGSEFDSNLAIESEESSSESDIALLLGADAEFYARYKKNIRLNANYNFSESIHQDLSEFDLQTHVLRAGGDYDNNNDTYAAYLTVIHAFLDGSDYLSIHQVSPSFSRLIGNRFYSRNTLTFGEKHYKDQAFRNSYLSELQSDLYFFQKGTSLYWLGSIAISQDNAAEKGLDYLSLRMKGQWIKKLEVFDYNAKARMDVRWEQRNYNDSLRDETRIRFQTQLNINIDKQLTITPFLEYGNYASEIPELDYSQILLGALVHYLF